MIHLFLNGLAASAGGGLTYLRNVIPELSRREDVRTTVAIGSQLRREFANLPNVTFLELDPPGGSARRFYWEQSQLPGLIRRSGADILISAGNFALRASPVPQILLSRNSLYTSADFYRDLRDRGEYGLWLDTRIKGALAKRSIQWADRTVAPTQAFADDLQRWTGKTNGKKVIAIHHGFDPDAFFRDQSPLPAEVREKLDSARDAFRLLFVSHYNYYRNFETLLRAIPHLRQRLAGRPVRLFLTCKLQPGENPGSYRTEGAAALVNELGIRNEVVELGSIPYGLLHHVYRACDVYVTPAYAETFAHPLVEAMACGLSIVASDLAVHREICGDAANYFLRSSPIELAGSIAAATVDNSVDGRRGESGKRRALNFSWRGHVDRLLTTAEGIKRAMLDGAG
jgi:glycosyltransferase involved in cell wall biosynthesis